MRSVKHAVKLWFVLFAVLVGNSAFALGFSVRGALRFDATISQFGGEAELEYADKFDANWTWGVRASLQAIPFSGVAVLIVPNAFLEYRQSLDDNTSAYGKLELGIGWLPQFFPRAVLTGGLDARFKLVDLDAFAQGSAYFDFIVTNRAKLGAAGRVGLIVIPFVPFIGAEASFDFYPGRFAPKVFVGSLLYLSQQFFVGLEAGIDPNVYVRVFFQFSER